MATRTSAGYPAVTAGHAEPRVREICSARPPTSDGTPTGRVCAKCAYEFDQYFSLLGFFRGSIDKAKAFQRAKEDGSLPQRGPRGADVNVRKPDGIPVAFRQAISQTYGVRI